MNACSTQLAQKFIYLAQIIPGPVQGQWPQLHVKSEAITYKKINMNVRKA